jgi:DNA primase
LTRRLIIHIIKKVKNFFWRKFMEKKQGKVSSSRKHNVVQTIGQPASPINTTDTLKDDGETSSLTVSGEKETLKLLKSKNLLYGVGEHIEKAGLAGERRNGLIVYVSQTSRIQKNPISLVVKGPSAAGKNYLVRTVTRLLPKVAYTELTRMTGQAMLYSNESFAHKAILICEKEGMEQALYNIRAMQSEGKLIFETVRGLKGERIEKEGPASFIVTTTAPMIHIENETRNFSVYMDETDEQTKRVKDKIADQHSQIHTEFSFLTIYQNAQRLLKYYPVKIPYAKFLSENTPNRPLRMRRDFGKLLAGIETIALLHQFQREIKEDKGTQYLVATLEDYYMAATLFGPTFVESLSGTSQWTQKLIDAIFSLYKKNEEKPVTAKELEENLKISRDTIERWIKPAIEAGEVEVQVSRGRIAKTYRPGEKRDWISGTDLPDPKELAEAFPSLSGNSSVIDPITGARVVIK